MLRLPLPLLVILAVAPVASALRETGGRITARDGDIGSGGAALSRSVEVMPFLHY